MVLRLGKYRIKPLFAWYDIWVGVFVDAPKHRVYVFPGPCIGIMMEKECVTST